MINEINIRFDCPTMEILDYLEQGKVSFEEAILSIKKGGRLLTGAIPAMGVKTAPFRMDLVNLTPYL